MRRKQEPLLWSNSFVGFGMKRHKTSSIRREADLHLYSAKYFQATLEILAIILAFSSSPSNEFEMNTAMA
jgi:hypothetical protein